MAGGPTRITVLVENTAGGRGLLAEHGLSFWIEHRGRRILMDTGQGLSLAHNARQLGIDLATAGDVVLSHGHYDHTGGLAAARPCFARPVIHVHPAAFGDRYARDDHGRVRPVGSPFPSPADLESHAAGVALTGVGPVHLGDGIHLTGEIPRREDGEDVGGAFFLDEACTKPDDIVDDQALWLETASGPVVLLGCAHAGTVNTLLRIRELTGARRIRAVLGGMHLLHAGRQRLRRTIDVLRELDVQQLGLAHCTGFAAMAWLDRAFPGRCILCHTGVRLDFD